MFNSRGSFSGQRPMGMHRMNQPGLNQQGMNLPRMGMSSMNMSGMGMSGMGMSSMNQTSMNLSSMNTPVMNSGLSQPLMGLSGMNSSLGLNNMNQSGVNVYRMGPPGMNQGGMGFQSEMKSQGFGMRPMDSPGSFLGSSDPMGMKNMPLRPPMHTSPERLMGPQSMSQRFPSPSGPVPPGPPRMLPQNQEMSSLLNRALTHPSDHLRGNPKPPLQEPHHMKEKPLGALGVFRSLSQEMGMKSGPSSMDQMPGPKNRYTDVSASSILSSFGLSNEDLEELSRYPDEELTPGNLPNILRDIRLRKINRSGPSHDQGGGGGRRPGGEVVPSKVIDYGHSSKFPYSDNSVSSRPFESSRADRKSSPISKEPPPPSASTQQDIDNSMLNQIPTLCHRKASLPAQKSERSNSSNNKTFAEEPTKRPSDSSGNAPNIPVQADSSSLCDIPVILDADMTTEAPIGTLADQGNYPPPVEAAPPGKANWSSPMSQEEMQKMKKLPTPSMMNDYFAASPRIFPHICSLCNVECRHVKDWVKHQNNTTHIENCRKLRQQYPDWNPQVHTLRDDGKEGPTTKRSRSKSGSPRRSRRSGSRHRIHRSNSPRAGKRSRSRSPRRARRSPMRSRSPRKNTRSRSPRKNTRSPQRSLSPRKPWRARSASSPDKRAVDAAVQRFVESNKVKSGEKERPAKPSSNGKTLPAKATSSSGVKGRKPSDSTSTSTRKASSTSSSTSAKKPSGTTSPSRPVKKPSDTTSPSRSVRKPNNTSSPSRSVRKPNNTSSPSSSSRKPASSSSVRKPASSINNRSSNNAPRKPLPPRPGPSSSDPKKPVVSTGAKKTTPATTAGKKPPISQQKAPSTQKPSEPFNALNKFLFAKGGAEKVIHVTNLPDSGYTDQDILKIVQPFGRVCDILIVRSKNEAFLETNFIEAATAAVKFSETSPVVINHKRVTLSLVGQNKEQPKPEAESSNDNSASEKPSPETVNVENQLKVEEKKEDKVEKEEPKEAKEEKEPAKTQKVKPDLGKVPNDTPPDLVKRYRLIDPPLMDSEKCVVVISNLPEKQYTEEEISNLAKPFGGATDTLIISTHRKAYLELSSRNSVDSMMKFYSVFPTFLGGNSLNIAMSTRYKDVKDENRIFAEILEQAPYKITPSIYEKFVYLSNLPEKEIDEFEIARFGLRFGKVEHYMIISNKKKAILHMNTASAAKTMKNFLTRYPVSIEENVLSCSLANKKSMAEEEYESYMEEEKSSEPETNLFDGEVAPTPDEVKKDPNYSLPTSPVSEMDTDETANPGEECEEEDDDEEEAAEAPEAPEGSSVFVQPQPVEQQQEYNKAPQTYTSEEMDVLVSVESDEEEYDTQDSQNMAILMTAEESEEHDSELETSSKDGRPKPTGTKSSLGKEPHLKGVNTSDKERKSESEGNEEESAAQVPENVTKGSGSTDKKGTSSRSGDRREKDTKHSSHSSSRYERSKPSDDKSRSYDDRSRSRNERSRHSGGSKERDHTAADATRTAKYNPQKGDICVTLTVDGQKSSRTPDPRKRSSGERASSGRESSTPKSSSNRSSPSENTTGNKSTSGAHQSKSSHRSTSSQDKDSKVTPRSRETDSRSAGRKDDRSKDSSSSSSRHARSTRPGIRGQRSKEDDKATFPFNLDEFVTVDEIVEDRGNSQKAKAAADAAKGGKRKETATPTPDSKKAKQESSTPAKGLSFVTLDEVGDEETSDGKNAQALVTADTEDAPTAGAKDSEMLMTLDEVSDEEDAQATAAELLSSTVPKDQLLTLDEVCAEDEEQTSDSKQNRAKALQAKADQKALETSVSEQGQDSQAEQSLLTLDEVEGEDEDEGPRDAELQFLTVDEIGEEEEAAEQTDGKSQPSKRVTKSQPAAKTPAGKRVGLRKRALPEDTSQQSPADSTTGNQPEKTPAKTTKGKTENSISPTPDKAETSDAASKGPETQAKKAKLETPAKEKLGPFNSSVAVGMEYLVPKTGFFCELCSLFYMDDASKLKHCKSLRHYQAVQKQLTEEESAEGKTPST